MSLLGPISCAVIVKSADAAATILFMRSRSGGTLGGAAMAPPAPAAAPEPRGEFSDQGATLPRVGKSVMTVL